MSLDPLLDSILDPTTSYSSIGDQNQGIGLSLEPIAGAQQTITDLNDTRPIAHNPPKHPIDLTGCHTASTFALTKGAECVACSHALQKPAFDYEASLDAYVHCAFKTTSGETQHQLLLTYFKDKAILLCNPKHIENVETIYLEYKKLWAQYVKDAENAIYYASVAAKTINTDTARKKAADVQSIFTGYTIITPASHSDFLDFIVQRQTEMIASVESANNQVDSQKNSKKRKTISPDLDLDTSIINVPGLSLSFIPKPKSNYEKYKPAILDYNHGDDAIESIAKRYKLYEPELRSYLSAIAMCLLLKNTEGSISKTKIAIISKEYDCGPTNTGKFLSIAEPYFETRYLKLLYLSVF